MIKYSFLPERYAQALNNLCHVDGVLYPQKYDTPTLRKVYQVFTTALNCRENRCPKDTKCDCYYCPNIRLCSAIQAAGHEIAMVIINRGERIYGG